MRRHRIPVVVLCSALLFGTFGSTWSDPCCDPLPDTSSPFLDIVGISAAFRLGGLEITLLFDSSITSTDLQELSGFVDFDTDRNENTGRPSHADEYNLSPSPSLGVDYYLTFYAYAGMAELTYVSGSTESSVTFCSTVIEESSVSVFIPKCQTSYLDGICIGARYHLVALVGNSMGFTDRAPNDASVFVAVPGPGDLDEDGDVDQDDVSLFKTCATGPAVGPPASGCEAADLDGDNDVDMSDFGILQWKLTGAM